jgi:hypothetical protein
MMREGMLRTGRVRVNLPCSIIIYTPQEETIDTVIKNICEGGVGLTLKKKLEVYSKVGLKIYEIGNEPIVCKGTVRWVKTIESSRTGPDYSFNMGIQFSEIKERDVLAIRNLVASKSSNPE